MLDTRGLPVCSQRLLRNTKPPKRWPPAATPWSDTDACGPWSRFRTRSPSTAAADLLAFNGRIGRRRAVILHAYLNDPPTVVVLPFLVRPGSGRFGTALVADLGAALGPSLRFAHFRIELSRQFSRRGRAP